MSTKVRLEISYDGTEYGGWQRQKSDRPTIQETVESSLSQLLMSQFEWLGQGGQMLEFTRFLRFVTL